MLVSGVECAFQMTLVCRGTPECWSEESDAVHRRLVIQLLDLHMEDRPTAVLGRQCQELKTPALC